MFTIVNIHLERFLKIVMILVPLLTPFPYPHPPVVVTFNSNKGKIILLLLILNILSLDFLESITLTRIINMYQKPQSIVNPLSLS